MVKKGEVVNILMNVTKFEESWEELIRGTPKLEQIMVKYSRNPSIAATVNIESRE